MKLTKKDISEIIDTHGDLIGTIDIPTNGSDLESQANGTTDTNLKIATQPFRYDMLGRFGFTLMPFMEGEEKNEGRKALEKELEDLMHQRFIDLLSHYKRNPKRIQSDYRKHVTDGEISDEAAKFNKEWADKVIKVFQKSAETSMTETIDEGKVMDKQEDKLTSKSEDKEIREKKLEKIAGLINKLEKKDIDKLINLLEANR